MTISNLRFLHDNPHLEELVRQCLVINPVQFWLDCSTMHPVISAVQKQGDKILQLLFKLSRNYCHRLHMARMEMLDL